MASWGGHTLPGTFFIIFGIFYSFKFSRSFLKSSRNGNRSGGIFYCCRGKIPCSGLVIEGVVKIVCISIGTLVELFYPGAPMGHLYAPDGKSYTHPMNWQHATMYLFFGLSGVTDILAYSAKHVLPAGIDRIGGALALFIEGYLFFFHLHGRSMIDTRVHILLVLTVWPSALCAFLECLVMNKRKILHIFEMLHSTLLIAQGTWFWQAAYILYPPGQDSWDPCMVEDMHAQHNTSQHFQDHDADSIIDCNDAGELNLMFMTMFWAWHIAGCFIFVGTVYFLVYKLLKLRGQLDPRFTRGYEHMNGTKLTSSTPLNPGLISSSEEDEL